MKHQSLSHRLRSAQCGTESAARVLERHTPEQTRASPWLDDGHHMGGIRRLGVNHLKVVVPRDVDLTDRFAGFYPAVTVGDRGSRRGAANGMDGAVFDPERSLTIGRIVTEGRDGTHLTCGLCLRPTGDVQASIPCENGYCQGAQTFSGEGHCPPFPHSASPKQ